MSEKRVLDLKYPPRRLLNEELLRQLRSPNRNIFWMACEKLELLAEEYLINRQLSRAVERNLRHADAWRRSMAAGVIKKFPEKSFLTALHRALIRESKRVIDPMKDLDPTDDFLEALDAIGDRSSIPVFRQYLNHPDDCVQYTAITALAGYRRGISFATLVNKLRTRDREHLIRLAAVRGLYQLCKQDEKQIKRVLPVIAGHLLRRLPRNQEYGEFIGENLIDYEIREMQCRFSGSRPALKYLIAASRSRHFSLRLSAGQILVDLCNHGNSPRIIRVLRKRQRAEKVRWFRLELQEEIEKIEAKLNF